MGMERRYRETRAGEARRMTAAAPALTPSLPASPPRAARPAPRRRLFWPWQDRTGRLSLLKLTVLVLALLPGAALAWELASGQMGPEPFKQAARECGEITIRLLLVTLVVTPLRSLADWPRIVLVRRMLGVITLAYALVHLGLYAAHMNGQLLLVAREILERIYLTNGFVALLGLVALGITSTDGWMRRLGRGWKRLHRLVFPIAALGLLHYFMQSKADVTAPTLLSGLFLWLLCWRALPGELRTRPSGLLALVPVTALGTALVEYAWYALATSIPAERVLLANLDVGLGLRPAVLVGLFALGVAVLPSLRRAAEAMTARRAAALAGPGGEAG